MSDFDRWWRSENGMDVAALALSGRVREVMWLSFKEGWQAANAESPNIVLSNPESLK